MNTKTTGTLKWLKYQNVNGEMFENHSAAIINPNPAVSFLIQGDPDLGHLDDYAMVFIYMDNEKTVVRCDDMFLGENMKLRGRMMNIGEKTASVLQIPFDNAKIVPQFKIFKMHKPGVYKITSQAPGHQFFYLIIQI